MTTSERDSVETALRESEARYRSALIAGRMGSWETDLIQGTRIWTEEGMALFGLRLPGGRGQVGGADDEYQAALHPDDRHLAADFIALADAQDSFAAEYRIVRPDGITLWLSGRGLVVARRPDGRAARLVSIMADVSERRQAEEGLRLHRERLALALHAGQMGVYDYDLHGDVLWWSPQTYVVFGVDPATFTPTPPSVLALIHPDDRDGFLAGRMAAIAERRPFRHEFRSIRPDGRMVWINHRGQAEYDAAGRPVRNFGVSLDITERKLAEEVLRDADRAKDTFIATLAHELRNPLAPIRNAVAVLRDGGHDDAQVAWCRGVIERQVAQMSRLLEDLLDVSRLSRGQFALRKSALDLGGVLEQAIEVARPLIDAAGHSLVVELPPGPVRLEGDATRLAQVFSNLLVNAAKYTHPGGRIELAVTREGTEVAVRVQDNGVGIPAEQLPALFEMFAQSHDASERTQGGLGIGLALARGFVEMHGGRIEAVSAGPGLGSAFVVRLPALAEAPPSADEQRTEPSGPSAGGLRILVADDLRDSADSLAMLLQTLGHEVRIAYDGEAALEALDAFAAEVGLLDLGMPKLDGYGLCRRIRESAHGRRMTLIAHSGWGQEADRRKTAEAGFDHHLVKPVDPDALDALLARIARSRPTTPLGKK